MDALHDACIEDCQTILYSQYQLRASFIHGATRYRAPLDHMSIIACLQNMLQNMEDGKARQRAGQRPGLKRSPVTSDCLTHVKPGRWATVSAAFRLPFITPVSLYRSRSSLC
jgi:hypothetical protein